jgi:DNA-binding transcriptional regulator of glucitol operon
MHIDHSIASLIAYQRRAYSIASAAIADNGQAGCWEMLGKLFLEELL